MGLNLKQLGLGDLVRGWVEWDRKVNRHIGGRKPRRGAELPGERNEECYSTQNDCRPP
jgi:hypothetical protein